MVLPLVLEVMVPVFKSSLFYFFAICQTYLVLPVIFVFTVCNIVLIYERERRQQFTEFFLLSNLEQMSQASSEVKVVECMSIPTTTSTNITLNESEKQNEAAIADDHKTKDVAISTATTDQLKGDLLAASQLVNNMAHDLKSVSETVLNISYRFTSVHIGLLSCMY